MVVLVLLALVPLRALAAVTIGICAAANQQTAIQAKAVHEHASHNHYEQASEPQSGANPDCSVCVEHCTSASVVVPDAPTTFPGSIRAERIAHGERFAAGFVPEHLDPPPLAL